MLVFENIEIIIFVLLLMIFYLTHTLSHKQTQTIRWKYMSVNYYVGLLFLSLSIYIYIFINFCNNEWMKNEKKITSLNLSWIESIYLDFKNEYQMPKVVCVRIYGRCKHRREVLKKNLRYRKNISKSTSLKCSFYSKKEFT